MIEILLQVKDGEILETIYLDKLATMNPKCYYLSM